jgi:ATP-dependent Clp protease ATP-binding subunit ClpA
MAKQQGKTSKTPMLDSFGKDLTQLAIEGKLDPVVGREKEIKRCSQILARRKKNNPILIGEPGVGKCVIGKTPITIRRKSDGTELTITIDQLLHEENYKF